MITDAVFQALRSWNHVRLRWQQQRAARRIGESRDYARWVRDHDTLDDAQRAVLVERARQLPYQPLISVLMPVHNPYPHWLADAIESVRKQLYPHWELCIADDHSTDPCVIAVLRRFESLDDRIRVVFRDRNGHISAATNSALGIARGEYVALLDHDDRIAEHALLCIAEAIVRFPEAGVIYSDEDKLDGNGRRCDPYFKCDFNLELFRGQNMISHLGAYRTALVREVDGFRAGFEGAQDYDLALRCIERLRPEQIVHIPHVLYHWRVHQHSTALSTDAKPYAMVAGKRALDEHFTRVGLACEVEAGSAGWYRCHYALPEPAPSVSVIVVDTTSVHALDACVQALGATDYPRFDLDAVAGSSDMTLPGACNAAIAATDAEFIAIVDSRCTFASSDWLRRLVAQASLPDAGAVGAKMLSRRGRIVGNAQLLGIGEHYAPLASGTRSRRGGYCGRAMLAQQIGALGEGCIVLRRGHFRLVGWLDPTHHDLGAAFVDLTWRLQAYGFHNHWTPLVEATLAPQSLRKRRIAEVDARRVGRRWGFVERRDSHYNVNLGLAGRFHLASPPRVSFAQPWFVAPPGRGLT